MPETRPTVVDTRSWSPQVQAEVAARLSSTGAGRWLAQVEQVRQCAHPVRLVGHSDTIDPATGEILASYSTETEPDRIVYVRCGNRRRAVCPSCSHEYQGDMWHVIMAGAAGGIKDVPATVAQHPLIFATLTAPSFGPVHTAKKPGRRGTRRCRPRTGEGRSACPHGRSTWCMTTHEHGDPVVGQPLCADCYDYGGHLVWQWHAPELWRRFTIKLKRRLAQHLGVTENRAQRLVRVQFAKVAEFQQRGMIHFHALIRLDGIPIEEDPFPAPAVDVDNSTLAELVIAAARDVWVQAPPVDRNDRPRLLRFGSQLDARSVHRKADRDNGFAGHLHPETVAAYIAKYATKAAADGPAGDQPNPHLHRLKAVLRDLTLRAEFAGLTCGEGPYRRWGRWADMLGFRGHFSTKSRRYSTTLGRLRQARRDHTRRTQLLAAGRLEDQDEGDLEDTTLVVGWFRYAGMGWLTSGDAALAAASAARARDA